VRIGTALLALCAAAGSAAAVSDAELALIADPARQRRALAALEARISAEWRPLLQALAEGALYRYQGRFYVLGAGGVLVDGGGQPLLSASGEPFLPEHGLEAVALELDNIAAVQALLNRIDLFGPDPERRKEVVLQLGGSGGPQALALLEQARARERDAGVRAALVAAIARARLGDPEPAARLEAMELFAASRSEAALPLLRERAAEDPDAALRAAAGRAVAGIESYLRWRNLTGHLLSGLSLASVLLIMSLGLAVTFGLMGVINMAHGEMLMIGCYTAYVMQELFARRFPAHQDYYFLAALPLAALAAGSAGFAVEAGLLRRLYGRPLETLLATWGLSMVLQQAARLRFGDQCSVNAPSFFRGGFEVMPGLVFPHTRTLILALSVLCLAAVHALLHRSAAGIKIRAVMQSRSMASCLGVSTRAVDSRTFAFGAALAGLGGCALALIGTVEPGLGQKYVVDAFMVVVLGGVGNLSGTVLASLGIGMANKLLEPAIPGTAAAIYAKVATLGLVVLFLQWRPSGIFAARGRAAEALR
jgi:urea transport system permease protein